MNDKTLQELNRLKRKYVGEDEMGDMFVEELIDLIDRFTQEVIGKDVAGGDLVAVTMNELKNNQRQRLSLLTGNTLSTKTEGK